MIAKAENVNSEYDSWSDLEENFARAYEPIPLHINIETWRGMSKRDILKGRVTYDVRRGVPKGSCIKYVITEGGKREVFGQVWEGAGVCKFKIRYSFGGRHK